MMLLKLSWRNLWRNKRRTLITVAAIVFAVFLAIVVSSLQQGTWEHMIGSVVERYSGYIQIHKKGYWHEQTLDNAMPLLTQDSLDGGAENVQAFIPRIEAAALGAAQKQSMGAQVIGIDPQKETALTGMADRLVSGRYLDKKDAGVLITLGYAQTMKLEVNDTLVLLGQGYHGVTAVGKYPVRGIVDLGNPILNQATVFLSMPQAQYLFGMPGLVTAMVINLKNNYKVEETTESLRDALPERYEVMDWKEMNPSLVQAIQADTGGMAIMLIIIYIVIAFGIFSTILMMTMERTHEFGILKAIGMKSWRLSLMMFYETVFIAILGIGLGVLFTIPVLAYFKQHPIVFTGNMAEVFKGYGFEPMYVFSTEPYIFLYQVMTILIIVMIVYIYPLVQLNRLNAVTAMRE